MVELASPSDEGPRGVSALRQKMECYLRNGAQLGWPLLPSEQAVEIWRGDADDLFLGLRIALAEVWQV